MIALIVAMTKDRVIGRNNTLPWSIPEDLKHFRQTTKGNTVVMGRKTFESIGRPLPNRKNIVISSTAQSIPGVTVCTSVSDALNVAKRFHTDIYIIGGSSVFAATLPIADRLIISWVKHSYPGDIYFPPWNEKEWTVVSREDRGEFELAVYERHHETRRKF